MTFLLGRLDGYRIRRGIHHHERLAIINRHGVGSHQQRLRKVVIKISRESIID